VRNRRGDDENLTLRVAAAPAADPASTAPEGAADEGARQPERAGLVATGLTKQFRGRRVVNGVSLGISPGEVVGLLGPNGAGKTTTFHLILGLLPPNAGQVSLDGHDITALPMYLRARRGIGYLPQEASIFRRMTVDENLLSILEMRGVGGDEARERCEELIQEFGLSQVARSPGYALSGGERRRAEIARALASEPRYMMLDEPFAGIDPIAVVELQRVVVRLKEKRIGVLITDHNVRETLQITDHAYIISQGKIFRHGTPSVLASDTEVRKVYLGEHFRLH
jgi:lipopolysaccharide export system ATP-binding protein